MLHVRSRRGLRARARWRRGGGRVVPAEALVQVRPVLCHGEHPVAHQTAWTSTPRAMRRFQTPRNKGTASAATGSMTCEAAWRWLPPRSLAGSRKYICKLKWGGWGRCAAESVGFCFSGPRPPLQNTSIVQRYILRH